MRRVNVGQVSTVLNALLALTASALATYGQVQAQAWAGSWDGGGLPPSIAKPQPSAEVPADLPGAGPQGCRMLRDAVVYQQAGPGTVVAVQPWADGAAVTPPCGDPASTPKPPEPCCRAD